MTPSPSRVGRGGGPGPGRASTVGARCPAQGRPSAWARASSAKTDQRAPHQPDHAVGMTARPPPVDRGRAAPDAAEHRSGRPDRPTAARGRRRWPAGRTRTGRTGRRSRRPCSGRSGPSRRCRTTPAGRATRMPTPWVAPAAARGPGAKRGGQPGRVQPGPAVARRPAPRPDAVGRPGPLEDVDHRGTELDLEHAGEADGTGDGDQRRPGRLRRPLPAEPASTVAGDEGHLGQRLGVVDHDRSAAHPERHRLVDPQRRDGPVAR